MSHKNKFLTAAGALALIAGATFLPLSAMAQDFTVNPAFSDYGSWDLNDDGRIIEEEFSLNSYSVMDRDQDALISEDEWNDYTSNWFDPYEVNYGDFEYYDTDQSGKIDEREYSYVLEDTDLYAYWDYDSDGYVADTEYYDAINVYAGYDSDSY